MNLTKEFTRDIPRSAPAVSAKPTFLKTVGC